MDATNFAYWLNGFAELSGDTPPTEAQWASIREHLSLVFEKVTPPLDKYVTRQPTPDWDTALRQLQRQQTASSPWVPQ